MTASMTDAEFDRAATEYAAELTYRAQLTPIAASGVIQAAAMIAAAGIIECGDIAGPDQLIPVVVGEFEDNIRSMIRTVQESERHHA
ncbi:MAG: hypothetical protein Q4G49_03190 [Paracoccus sp. (in: a-proteobacteria)]|nr:hypothetical protein [Paracoccus sp. (in: a-proteobacteria)]